MAPKPSAARRSPAGKAAGKPARKSARHRINLMPRLPPKKPKPREILREAVANALSGRHYENLPYGERKKIVDAMLRNFDRLPAEQKKGLLSGWNTGLLPAGMIRGLPEEIKDRLQFLLDFELKVGSNVLRLSNPDAGRFITSNAFVMGNAFRSTIMDSLKAMEKNIPRQELEALVSKCMRAWRKNPQESAVRAVPELNKLLGSDSKYWELMLGKRLGETVRRHTYRLEKPG